MYEIWNWRWVTMCLGQLLIPRLECVCVCVCVRWKCCQLYWIILISQNVDRLMIMKWMETCKWTNICLIKSKCEWDLYEYVEDICVHDVWTCLCTRVCAPRVWVGAIYIKQSPSYCGFRLASNKRQTFKWNKYDEVVTLRSVQIIKLVSFAFQQNASRHLIVCCTEKIAHGMMNHTRAASYNYDRCVRM